MIRLLGTRLRTILDVVATLLVIGVSGTLLYNMWTGERGGVRPAAPRPARPRPLLPAEPVALDGAWLKGNRTAKVAIIEYSDFQCPFCAKAAVDALPEVDDAYVKTGRVLVAFRHLPLESIHPLAVDAGASAECAGRQGQFWPMHDRIFENPTKLDAPTLRQHAATLAIDLADYERCLKDGVADKVRAEGAAAAALGVSGTPTFLVGRLEPDGRVKVLRRLAGAQPFTAFKAVLDELLSQSGS